MVCGITTKIDSQLYVYMYADDFTLSVCIVSIASVYIDMLDYMYMCAC